MDKKEKLIINHKNFYTKLKEIDEAISRLKAVESLASLKVSPQPHKMLSANAIHSTEATPQVA